MEKIILNWLRGNYDTEMHGPPTWEMLVEAVRAPNGGNNRALADKIAEAHPYIWGSVGHALDQQPTPNLQVSGVGICYYLVSLGGVGRLSSHMRTM